MVAIGGEEVPEQRLGLAELVAVGGVDQGPARLGEPVEDPPRLVGLGAVPQRVPKLPAPSAYSETLRPVRRPNVR